MVAKHKVFISAESRELKSYRVKAAECLLKKGIEPVYFDAMTLTDEEIVEKMRRLIGDCDACICLIGECYGSEPSSPIMNHPRRSFTQLEYYFARELNKDVFVAFTNNVSPGSPSDEQQELRELQSIHRANVARDRSNWQNISNLLELEAMIGYLTFSWQSGASDQGLVSLPHFVSHWLGPTYIPMELQLSGVHVGQTCELEELKSRLIPKGVVTVVGPPGSGKTAMLQRFFSDAGSAKAVSEAFRNRPLALIYLVLSKHGGPNGTVRSLLATLGLNKKSLNELDDDDTGLRELLATQLKSQFPLAVFENAQTKLVDPAASACMVDVLRLIASFGGASVIVTVGAQPPEEINAKYFLQPEIRMRTLSMREATELIANTVHNDTLSAEVVKKLTPLRDVFYPSILVGGVQSAMRLALRAKRSITSDDLEDRIIETAANYFKMAHQDLADAKCTPPASRAGDLTPFGTLLMCAIVAMQPFTVEILNAANLPLPPLKELQDQGVIHEIEGRFRIIPLYRRVLGGILAELLGAKDASITEQLLAIGLDRLLRCVADATGPEGDDIAGIADEALAWLEANAPFAIALQDRLRQYVSASAIDDVVFPFPQEEATAFVRRLSAVPESRSDSRLSVALAFLSVASRYEQDADAFLSVLTDAVNAANTVSALNGQAVRIIDVAAYVAERRFCMYPQLLTLREQMVPRLRACMTGLGSRDLALLKWTTSWFLNCANLCLPLGKMQQAHDFLNDACQTMRHFREPISTYARLDSLDLHYRVKQIEKRLDGMNRRCLVQAANEITVTAINISRGHPLWLRRHMRVTRQLLDETAGSGERKAILETTLKLLAQVFQVERIEQVSLEVRVQVAALVRDAAQYEIDSVQRYEGARRALKLLESQHDELVRAAKGGDSRGLLVMARAQAFLAGCAAADKDCEQANEYLLAASNNTRRVLEISPSVKAWELQLRLIDQIKSPKLLQESLIDEEKPRQMVPLELRKAIGDYREWEKTQVLGRLDGQLELWCVQRLWQAEGSIESLARSNVGAEGWERLTPAIKLANITHIYFQRNGILSGIEHRFGPFPDLFIAMARNESQYQRMRATPAYGGRGSNNTQPILDIYARALNMFPGNWSIIAENARFHRYIWDYSSALSGYREAIQRASRAEERRELQVALAETLLTVAIHDTNRNAPDIPNNQDLLAEARRCIATVQGFEDVMGDAAVLRDQIEFEAGGNVDWKRLEETYAKIVGDDYVFTLSVNLQRLREENVNIIEHLAEVVQAEFTSVDVMRGFGILFLRRAEKTIDKSEAVTNAKRAYYIFCACRILENATLLHELPSTCYRRALSILVAAGKGKSCNPFPVDLGDKPNGLAYAGSLFSSVVSRTVGLFNKEARKRVSEVALLRKELT